ncbi:MAG: histidine phosphatase family protein [Pirellulales bacterium]|nr:histidine phosphatase family protein [Pirellulales bacterium]
MSDPMIPATTNAAGWPAEERSVLGTPLHAAVVAPPSRPAVDLKSEITAALWQVIDKYEWALSATFTGSFLIGDGLQGISDIDFVVIVEHLNAERFEALNNACEAALQPVVERGGYGLRINPTLGPLKFNDQRTAVLHLMLYSRQAHVDHVVSSPFTCYDWQRSVEFRKQSLADVYPVFALQPRHFLGARRSISDYLKDYRAGVVSYRELECVAGGYREVRREKPLTVRDRHEFAYHILRFLMQNLLKLVHRRNEAPEGEALLQDYLQVFALDADDVRRLYSELAAKKRAADFSWPTPDLDRRLEVFVANFESQFRRLFFTEATRHVVVRHAPTIFNAPAGNNRRFLGRTNPEIESVDEAEIAALCESIPADAIVAGFVSPLLRCQETYELLATQMSLPPATIDNRLMELSYGQCEGMSVTVAQKTHANLFAAWQRGEDPAFPGGESTADVARRALAFVDDRWPAADGATITCSHNVVLRTLIGHALRIPMGSWHRLQIPHLKPLAFIQTRRHGWFVDLDEQVERDIFVAFSNS